MINLDFVDTVDQSYGVGRRWQQQNGERPDGGVVGALRTTGFELPASVEAGLGQEQTNDSKNEMKTSLPMQMGRGGDPRYTAH